VVIQREHIIKSLRIIVPLIILFLIYHQTHDFFEQLDWDIVMNRIPQLSFLEVFFIMILGLIAIGFMTYYDILFNRRLQLNIPMKKIIKYSIIANTFNNFFGFGGIAGASIRTALFRKHHPSFKQTIKTIAWATPLMLAGVSVLLIFVLMTDMDKFIHFKGNTLLKPVLWGIVLFMPVYLGILAYNKKMNNKIDRDFIIQMLLTSAIEWFLCFVVFDVICEVIGISVPFSFLYGLFFIGKFISIASMTPGGIGTFDFVIIEGLHQHGVLKEDALFLMVLYRISYYILPWLIGLVLGMTELIKKK
jgi:uncharacterized membrane protein YbhN (UPF0104 family)